MVDNVSGNAGNNDLQANANATQIRGGNGDDVLRGRNGDDILVGGAGDDQLFGGNGADQFRFFGNQIGGASDTDRIYDLDFAEGDTLVFGAYNGLFTTDADGLNGFNNGDSAIISSYEGLASAVQAAGARASFTGSAANDLLFVTFDTGNGTTQTLRISNGYAAYIAAANTPA